MGKCIGPHSDLSRGGGNTSSWSTWADVRLYGEPHAFFPLTDTTLFYIRSGVKWLLAPHLPATKFDDKTKHDPSVTECQNITLQILISSANILRVRERSLNLTEHEFIVPVSQFSG